MPDIYWKLCYDINLPTSGKVKVHGVSWDEETQMLYVNVSTEDTPGDPEDYVEGSPLYEMDPEEGRYQLVGMNPISLGADPQSLVKEHHVAMAAKAKTKT